MHVTSIRTSLWWAILQEPLTHFLAIGLALFLLYDIVSRPDPAQPDEIVVNQAKVDTLAASFERTWLRAPTPEEQHDLVDSWVREEVLYREGIALRLDQGDSVVRRHIANRMSFIIEAMPPAVPTEAELLEWLDAHAADYRIPARFNMRQVYFDPARHGAELGSMIEATRSELEQRKDDAGGDKTRLPDTLNDVEASEIARIFGGDFAAAVENQPVGAWSGPLVSGFGVHLVYLDSKVPGRAPSLDEVRSEVERDLMRQITEESNERLFQTLRDKYSVEITATMPENATESGN